MERACKNCAHYDKDNNDYPCVTCNGGFNWEQRDEHDNEDEEETEMENKELFTEDVERIVNAIDRQAVIDDRYEKRQHRRQQKILNKAILACSIGLVFAVFHLFGLAADWLAGTIGVACGICGSFYAGRFLENGKCWGWH